MPCSVLQIPAVSCGSGVSAVCSSSRGNPLQVDERVEEDAAHRREKRRERRLRHNLAQEVGADAVQLLGAVGLHDGLLLWEGADGRGDGEVARADSDEREQPEAVLDRALRVAQRVDPAVDDSSRNLLHHLSCVGGWVGGKRIGEWH